MILVVNTNMERPMLHEQYVSQSPSKKIKRLFTLVLKGHIGVVTSNLNKNKTGQD